MAIQPISSYSQTTLPIPSTSGTAVRDTAAVEHTAATNQQAAVSAASASISNADAVSATALKQPSREQVDQAMKEVKQALPESARNLQFSIDEATGKTVVKVVDPATKEVIRQIPSEELLNIARALDKHAGLLVKHKV